MSKKILVVTSSLRANSNSDMLAQAFAAGAQAAGHSVETISLKKKSIAFCRGCMACQKTQKCAIHDDASEIAERIGRADVVAFATPVYYYGLSGQLKTLLDRCNPLFVSDYAFRDVYLIATAADEDVSAVEGCVKGMQGWVDCFERARLAGTVFCGGVDGPGAIEGNSALRTAYQMGEGV